VNGPAEALPRRSPFRDSRIMGSTAQRPDIRLILWCGLALAAVAGLALRDDTRSGVLRPGGTMEPLSLGGTGLISSAVSRRQ
jgi:hypothetical protein